MSEENPKNMHEQATLIRKIQESLLFEGVDAPIIEHLLHHASLIDYQPGDIVFEHRSLGSAMYLILTGSVKLIDASTQGKEVILGVLSAGDFLGEMELLDGQPRSAEASADSYSILLEISDKEFSHLVERSPRFSSNLMKALSLRLRSSNLSLVRQGETYVESFQRQLFKLHRLIEATRTVNSTLDLDRLLELILDTSTKTTDADRGTIYLVDEEKKELWSKVFHGSSMVEIRLPIGKGIAGYVAKTGETLNLENAYADSRFNPDVDKLSGYHTSSMLCMPMRNRERSIIGVFQLLNKKVGVFTRGDEEFIEALSVHAAIAIENARIAQNMVQTERLSAVGRMASTIIHDIKNPMGTLRVYAQVMKKRTENEETAMLADEMIRQIDRFVTMTQEILDFSRGISSMSIEELELGPYFDSVLTVMRYDLEKRKISLQASVEYKGKARLDPDKFMRVLTNIASNAADAMPDGGRCTMRVRKEQKSLVVEMTDTGVGIPADILPRVFQPFVTHGKKHGTGLGMAIVKKIIDDHLGSITIASEEGKGTTVRIELPLA